MVGTHRITGSLEMKENGIVTVPDDLSQGYSDVIVVSIVIHPAATKA